MALSDIQTLVDNYVRDASATVSTADRDVAIDLAVQRLSEDKPRTLAEDVVSDGTNFLPLPASWESDFSAIDHLEYPIGNTPPDVIDQSEWSMYLSPTGWKIQTLYAIGSGDSVRVQFTIAHVLDATTDTVLMGQREAVAAYAASIALQQLAAKYTNDGEPTIAADAVDHQNKGRDYALRARDLRKIYFQRLGIKEQKTVAAGAVVDLDLRDSRNRDRLTHPRRYR